MNKPIHLLLPLNFENVLRLIFIFFSLFLLTNHAIGQTEPEDSSTLKALNEITIQDSRIQIPFSQQNRNITIVDRMVINTLPVKSVNELLLYVAGVDVRQRGPWGTQADIGIDGGTFDQTLVLVNGMKMTDPQTGHNMMNLPVNLQAISRLEILKGASARVYGINALNGAINIITRQPASDGLDINLYAGSSFQKDTSNGKLFSGYGAEATASLAGEKVSHLISASHAQSSGYRYNTAFRNEKVFYQNKIDLGSERSVQVLGGYVFNDFGANGFYAAPGDIESREIVQTAIAGVSGILPINDFWTLRPRLSYRYNQDDYLFIKQKPDEYRNIHGTNVWNAELNNTFYSGAGNFGLGLEARNEAINSNSLGERSRWNYGVFGEYSFNKINNLLINIGTYVNYNSDFGWQMLPGIDAGYTFYKDFRFFVNAGTGQRLPTYTDLYYQGPSNIGNATLKPEHSVHSEAGFKYNSAQLNASVSYFLRNTSDFIDWVKTEIEDPWQPQNFQKIETQGISFSADYRLMDAATSSNFDILAGLTYTWLHLTLKEKANKMSRYALENLRNQVGARIAVGYRSKCGLSLGAKYQQRINYADYVLVDTRLSGNFSRFEVYADVNNLTNVTFIEAGAVPMSGRWMTLGVKFLWREN